MKTMIYLTESSYLELKHRAVDERTSMAELIRRAVEAYMKTPAKKGGGNR